MMLTSHVGNDFYGFLDVVGVITNGITVLNILHFGDHKKAFRAMLAIASLLSGEVPRMRFTEQA